MDMLSCYQADHAGNPCKSKLPIQWSLLSIYIGAILWTALHPSSTIHYLLTIWNLCLAASTQQQQESIVYIQSGWQVIMHGKCRYIFTTCMLELWSYNKQLQIPHGATLLGTILSSDKTNITTLSGGHVAHPLLIGLANIKMSTRLKLSSHSFMLTALLPIPKFIHPSRRMHGVLEDRLVHHASISFLTPLSRPRDLELWCLTLMVTCSIDLLPLQAISMIAQKQWCWPQSVERLCHSQWWCSSNLATHFITSLIHAWPLLPSCWLPNLRSIPQTLRPSFMKCNTFVSMVSMSLFGETIYLHVQAGFLLWNSSTISTECFGITTLSGASMLLALLRSISAFQFCSQLLGFSTTEESYQQLANPEARAYAKYSPQHLVEWSSKSMDGGRNGACTHHWNQSTSRGQ